MFDKRRLERKLRRVILFKSDTVRRRIKELDHRAVGRYKRLSITIIRQNITDWIDDFSAQIRL